MKSNINIEVVLDNDKVPQEINWAATDSSADMMQKAKAMMVSFWDGADKSALRIDLWTKEMMVDEMGDFFYQSLMGMADTFDRSTGQHALAHEMKHFAQDFFKKFQENLRQQG